MKVEENVTVYQCEHCKKKMFRKHAMELHEKWCPKNPDNFKACNYCRHLEQTDVTIYWDGYDGPHESIRKGFRCTKLDKLLFPLSVERRGLNLKYDAHFEDQEPMPKTCEYSNDGIAF